MEYKTLAPLNCKLSTIKQQTPLRAFDHQVLKFVGALSKQLLSDKSSKPYPELIALGFWLRPANIDKLLMQKPKGAVKALGLAVHFTPTNVDTMFIYSWICALLMGNNNIVRVASQSSDIQRILFSHINQLFSQPKFNAIGTRNVFVQYDKASSGSAELSAMADVRVIWGGDDSVKAIRTLATPARCRDICFADRYSASLINGNALDTASAQQTLAKLIWKDTEAYSQQACSSPRVIFWLGNSDSILPFFESLNQFAKSRSSAAINQLNNHLVTTQLIQTQQANIAPYVQDHICALPLDDLQQQFLDWHLGSGYFFVIKIKDIEELEVHTSDKLQTLAYWQVASESLLKLSESPSIHGLDRIVPVGQALDFNMTWDGFDLLTMLSRQIVFSE